MQFHKVIIIKVYLFSLFWFAFYSLFPPLLIPNILGFEQKALYYSLISITAFTLGYFIVFLKKKNIYRQINYEIKPYQLFYLYVITLLLYLFFGTFFALLFSLVSAWLTIKLFYMKKYLFVFTIFIITFLLLIFEFTRMYLLAYILFVFMSIYLKDKKLHFVKILSIVFVSIALLVSMIYIRQGKDIDVNHTTIILKENPDILLKMIDTYFVYEIYTKVIRDFPKKHDYIYGASLVKPFVFWIPRFIWEDKPESLTSYIGRYYYGTSRGKEYSTGMTITGEFYINGGLVGILVLSFLFGVITAFFTKEYLCSAKEYIKIFSIVYIVSFPSLMRGGIAATAIGLFIIFIYFYLFSKFKYLFKYIPIFKNQKKLISR